MFASNFASWSNRDKVSYFSCPDSTNPSVCHIQYVVFYPISYSHPCRFHPNKSSIKLPFSFDAPFSPRFGASSVSGENRAIIQVCQLFALDSQSLPIISNFTTDWIFHQVQNAQLWHTGEYLKNTGVVDAIFMQLEN